MAALCLCISAAHAGVLLDCAIEDRGFVGQTYYVSPTGSDAAKGSKSSPFLSLQRGVDQLKPGDTLLIREGVYRNDNDMAVAVASCQGTEENWIRIANYPGEKAVIRFDSQRGLRLAGAAYVVVEGLEIDGRSDEIGLEEATEYAEAFDNTGTRESRFFGVGVRVEADDEGNYPHHVIIRNCRIYRTAGGGIAAARSDYLLIEGNEVFETSFYSPWGESSISVWESANFNDDRSEYRTVIKDNLCYRNDNKVKFWMTKTFSDGNGIILDALRTNQDILGDGYSEPYSGRILIVNNICFGNGGRGINLYESNSMDVVHNTLLRNSQRSNSENEIECGRVSHALIANNIIVAEEEKHPIGGYEFENIKVEGNVLFDKVADGVPLGRRNVTGIPVFKGLVGEDGTEQREAFQLKSDSVGLKRGLGRYSFAEDTLGAARSKKRPTAGAIE